jgi:hypothetical protein
MGDQGARAVKECTRDGCPEVWDRNSVVYRCLAAQDDTPSLDNCPFYPEPSELDPASWGVFRGNQLLASAYTETDAEFILHAFESADDSVNGYK